MPESICRQTQSMGARKLITGPHGALWALIQAAGPAFRAEWIPGLVAQNPDGSLPDCHARASGSAPCTSLTLLACLRINCKSGVHRAASTSILVSSLLRVLGVMAEVFLPSLVFPDHQWRAIMDRMKLWVMRLLAQGALHCLTCLSPGRRGATATPTVTEPYKSTLTTNLPTAASRSRASPRTSRALSIQCAATNSRGTMWFTCVCITVRLDVACVSGMMSPVTCRV